MFGVSHLTGFNAGQGSILAEPPTLSSATDVSTGQTSGNLGVDTDANVGTVYWVVTQSATTPSAAQIKAGNDHNGSTADDSGSISVTESGTQAGATTGLTASTTYYAHFVHENTVNGTTSNTISADGFTTDSAGDVTAPTLSSPTDAAASATTASIGVDTDEDNGTLYWVITTASNTPSAAQVKAGQDHTGAAATKAGSQVITSTGTKSATPTGLTANTAYYAHFMHEDNSTNQSSVADGDGFTTWPAKPATEELTTPGAGNWTIPSAATYYKLKVTVDGAQEVRVVLAVMVKTYRGHQTQMNA